MSKHKYSEATGDRPAGAEVEQPGYVEKKEHRCEDGPPLGPEECEQKDNWVHRSEGMKCLRCMWFVMKFWDHYLGAHEIGRCRKRAPTLQGWPVVFGSDWCGDHKLK